MLARKRSLLGDYIPVMNRSSMSRARRPTEKKVRLAQLATVLISYCLISPPSCCVNRQISKLSLSLFRTEPCFLSGDPGKACEDNHTATLFDTRVNHATPHRQLSIIHHPRQGSRRTHPVANPHIPFMTKSCSGIFPPQDRRLFIGPTSFHWSVG